MKIIVSAGDCNGIGLEVFLKALRRSDAAALEAFVGLEITLAAHPDTALEYAEALGAPITLRGETLEIRRASGGSVSCRITPCRARAAPRFGEISAEAGAHAFEALEIAARETLEGRADAALTLPVSKYALAQAGFPYPGQTEFFAARSKERRQTLGKEMMILLASLPAPDNPGYELRVGLATVHEPLARVAALVTRELVLERVRAFDATLRRDFGCERPTIAVLGVNPHAGENGAIGREELEAVEPALEQARSEGICAEGAFAADGFFAHGAYKRYDGVLAAYHDQGLIPLKLLAGGAGVNFSAGLPIIRVSPDHGTAFGIAGQGVADESSLLEALRAARRIARFRASSEASR